MFSFFLLSIFPFLYSFYSFTPLSPIFSLPSNSLFYQFFTLVVCLSLFSDTETSLTLNKEIDGKESKRHRSPYFDSKLRSRTDAKVAQLCQHTHRQEKLLNCVSKHTDRHITALLYLVMLHGKYIFNAFSALNVSVSYFFQNSSVYYLFVCMCLCRQTYMSMAWVPNQTYPSAAPR